MKITNFNPVMLERAIKLTDGKNPYTDVYLLNTGRVFKYLKLPFLNSAAEFTRYHRFYNNFYRKLKTADELRNTKGLIIPDEISVDNKNDIKGFYYPYHDTPDLTDFFINYYNMEDITEFYLLLADRVEALAKEKVIVPDLITPSNILYDKEKKEIFLIDYDGMQIKDIPTNTISMTLRYLQNPILRTDKYKSEDGLFTKRINDMSILVDYLYRLSGINIAAMPVFQKIVYDEYHGQISDKRIEEIIYQFNDMGIFDSEIMFGYINIFSSKEENPNPKKLIKRFYSEYHLYKDSDTKKEKQKFIKRENN